MAVKVIGLQGWEFAVLVVQGRRGPVMCAALNNGVWKSSRNAESTIEMIAALFLHRVC
jgi:hypothetical protein